MFMDIGDVRGRLNGIGIWFNIIGRFKDLCKVIGGLNVVSVTYYNIL